MGAMYDEDCEFGIGLHCGEARTWAPTLQGDGTSKGRECMGDLSKNRAPIKSLPCLVKDGFPWIAPG